MMKLQVKNLLQRIYRYGEHHTYGKAANFF